MKRLFNALVKITGWPVQKILFRTKVYYEDKAVQSRRLKGPAILISNHTSVYDYAVFLFVFWRRTLRYQMAELLFRRRMLKHFLRAMGGIFPEARLPVEGEERPLPFKTSAAYIALESGAPVIPVYTNGSYFRKQRAEVIIGKPVFARDLWQDGADERTNLETISAALREKVIGLGYELETQKQQNRKKKES